MALFRPALDELAHLASPLNDGELEVAHALARFDDSWTVYIQPRLGQDQPDFVAVHDFHGVCAIEVKDWRPDVYRQRDDGAIEHRRSGERGWERSCEQPRFQAYRYRTTIYDQFFAMPDDAAHPTDTVRSVVVLPQMSNHEASRLLRHHRVNEREQDVAVWGGDGLRQSLDEIVCGTGCVPPRHQSIIRLRRQLADSWIRLEQGAPARLSPDARNIESNPSGARIRRVRGPSGSGKSFGLAARAARLASEGKSVLVLSFNTTLSNYLRTLVTARCRELPANPSLVTCTNIHRFCSRLADDAALAGITTRTYPDVQWFDRPVLRALEACEAGHEARYDAVLVDEGQDFTLDWWNLLRTHVVTPDGEMLLVADPTQDVYDKRAWTDEDQMLGAGFSGTWTDLKGSYRMPGDLVEITNQFAQCYVKGERLDGCVPAAGAGTDVTRNNGSRSVRHWHQVERTDELGVEVGREVVRLLRENPNLAPNDVAFLLERHRDGVDAVNEIEAAGYSVHHVFSNSRPTQTIRKRRFWPDADGIKGCTVHSFKGWESPTLVMGIGKGSESRRLAYVAMTRTKGSAANGHSFVSVVNADVDIADFQSRFEEWAPPDTALRVLRHDDRVTRRRRTALELLRLPADAPLSVSASELG
ncbi:MAG: NERD domain-containing protein/DEAD/DEAH box helicase [Ilumatobacter sp.]|uniref:nuclease-related domain-containing DEAD/DEAH box helicase n=1 Tax=Ilumatobacter sp. TaxID=1967498 RepID=UPI003C78849B